MSARKLRLSDAREIGKAVDAPIVIVLVIDGHDMDAVSWGESVRDCKKAEKMLQRIAPSLASDARTVSAEAPEDDASIGDDPE